MKKFVLGIGLALLIVSFGCQTEVNINNQPLFNNGVNVLQTYVIDGMDGTYVSNATVYVQLGNQKLTAQRDGDLYVIHGIPAGTFQVFCTATGFLDFMAMYTFTGVGTLPGSALTFEFTQIVMFPEGEAARDLVVSVYNSVDGSPITTGQVIATFDGVTTFDSFIDDELSDALNPMTTAKPLTLTGDLDTTGKVTFAAADLIVGATYDVNVFNAEDSNGYFMVPQENNKVKIGFAIPEVVIFMGLPALTPIVVKTNNETAGDYQTLVLDFPYAVEICSDPANHDWSDPFGTDRDGDTNNIFPDPTTPVTITFNSANTQATITPNIDPNNKDADDDLDALFTGIQFRIIGSTTCTNMNAIKIRGGANVNPQIHLRN